MIHQQIKNRFFSSVEHVVSDISQYAVHPDSDFQRSRKIPARELIPFLVSQGSSSIRVEMLNFWGLDSSMPTASALSQQRAKLKPETLEAVFRYFNSSAMELPSVSLKDAHYRFLAADGSACTFFSTPAFSSPDYYCCPGHSANGVYSMHLNAFYDLDTHTYTDNYIRFVDQAAAFDYIEYGSYDTYELSFRIARFPVSDSTYECIWPICPVMNSLRNVSRICTMPDGPLSPHSGN